MSQFKVYCATYFTLCFAVVKQHVIATAIIFGCQSNSFLINDAPQFKVVAFKVALFDVVLFNLAQFDAALFDI